MSNQQLKYSPKKCKHLKLIPKPTFQLFQPTTPLFPLGPFPYVFQRILQDFISPSICPPELKDALKICNYELPLLTLNYSMHIKIKNSLHKQSEKLYMCF
jgi:hypothetical protein